MPPDINKQGLTRISSIPDGLGNCTDRGFRRRFAEYLYMPLTRLAQYLSEPHRGIRKPGHRSRAISWRRNGNDQVPSGRGGPGTWLRLRSRCFYHIIECRSP